MSKEIVNRQLLDELQDLRQQLDDLHQASEFKD
jgi:hypothetical protein